MALGTPVAAAAAYSAASGTTVAPAYPTGILASDAVLLFVGQKPTAAGGGTVTTPTGWTLRGSRTNAGGYGATLGADTGNTNLFVYSWNTPVAGQTGNLTVTIGGNNVSWAFIVRIPTGGNALTFGSTTAERTTAPTASMSNLVDNLVIHRTGDMVVWAMCIPTDVTTPAQFSAQSLTSAFALFGTAVELNEPDSTTGNDIGGYSAYASVTNANTDGQFTINATVAGTLTNVRGPIVAIVVSEATTLRPGLYTNNQTFFSPTVSTVALTQTLTPELYTNNQQFFTKTLSATYSLTPALYTNTQAFFSPSVTQGAVTLAPTLYTNGQTFFAATVNRGTITLTPSLYTDGQTFFAPTAVATYTLASALYADAQTFYSAVITQGGGSQALLPGLYSNAQTFYAPTLASAYALTPALYSNAQTFYAPATSATKALTAGLYTNSEVFYAPTVSRGAVGLLPSLYTNAQTFFDPTVVPVIPSQTVAAPLFVNGSGAGGDAPYVLKYWNGSNWQTLYKNPTVY